MPPKKNKKVRMVFEVIINFDSLIDEETFEEEYGGDIMKLCKFMVKAEGVMGWYDEDLKLKSAEIL